MDVETDGSVQQSAPPDEKTSKRAGRRAARAEKKMMKSQREERKRDEASTVKTKALISLLTENPVSREEAEREAAMEFNQSIAPSMDLLKAAVPDASSPEEAWRAIEGRLGQPIRDPDAALPDHPVYQGDALVYQQLRRHYGRTSPGGSFRRGWDPGDRGGLPPILGGGH